ncbi:MAG: PilZ domain-containing protein [Gammaproteobacteria bacterium]|jgi:hypothetical protein
MEHRCAHRDPLQLTALLRTPDGVVRQAITKDVSATGACLTVTSGTPPPSNVVDVILPPAADVSWTRPLRIRGFVVRVCRNEIGLLWIEDCDWLQLTGAVEMQASVAVRSGGRS